MVFSVSTGAAVAPSNVEAVVVSSTNISVQWDGLNPCRHVNGNITLYRVRYTKTDGVVRIKDEPGEYDMNMKILLTGLTPFTSYSIQVTAVNEEGDVGVYSDPLTRQTLEESKLMTLIINVSSFEILLPFLSL